MAQQVEVEEEPDYLPDEFLLYLNAFIHLDTERTGLADIPWSKIVFYCQFYGLDADQTELMIAYIRGMDKVVLTDRAKRQAQANAGNSQGSSHQAPRPVRRPGGRRQ